MLEVLLHFLIAQERKQNEKIQAEQAARLSNLIAEVNAGQATEIDDAEWEPAYHAVDQWLRPNLSELCVAEIMEIDIGHGADGRYVAAGVVDTSFRGDPPVRHWFVVELDAALRTAFGEVLDFDPRPRDE
jgi:hypothetical protein